MLIEGYEAGSDITIMETIYQFPTRDSETNKRIDDFLIMVYRDNVTGKKHHKTLFRPNYTFYVTKEGETVPDHPLFFIEKDKVEPVTVPYSEIDKRIAEITGNMEFYNYNVQNKNRGENRKLHTDPRIFFSDVNIEDHYRFLFSKEYTNNIPRLNKAFFDIECDTINMMGDFVESGECPINCLSFHDERTDSVYTLILRNNKNPLIEEFEKKVNGGVINQEFIHNFVVDAVGGYKKAVRMGLKDTKFNLLFFDEEIQLIAAFFQIVHKLDPDFCMGWNSSAFDLQYFIDRIYALGYEPADIMCDQSWEVKIVKNFIDKKNINEFAERGDYTVISGNTVWIDQMIQYASRRKSKIGSFKSFKLDDIGFEVAGVKKLDYHHITTNLALLPYKDFLTFILYNIMDVIVQKCIEKKSNDIEYIFSKCVVNNTVYRKGHRQTIYLINRMASEFDKLGFVIGNNTNRWNEKPPKFLGALVGDPLKTNDYAKLKVDGTSISVADNMCDFDFKSLYPSIMGEFNIAPNTQIGRIDIDHTVYDHENSAGVEDEKYSRGGEFIENFVTDNIIEFSKRWLHLAGIMEFLEDMKEFESQYMYGAPYRRFRNIEGGLIENPVFDCVAPQKAVYETDGHEPAVVLLGTLKDSGLSTDYNTYIEKGV